jgi:MFS family permease
MERKWRALIIVCVAIFMLLLDITVVNVALPKIQSDLHTSFTDLEWVVDAYALLLATCVLNAGTLGDLLGRKRVFISGVILFTLASALCGSATTPLFLNLARGLQGVGGAIMFAVSLAILSQEFFGRERGTAFGIWGATVGAAVAIGPLVGGALTEWAGWRWIFFVNLPIGIACVFGAIAYLHECFSPAGSSRSCLLSCAATAGAGAAAAHSVYLRPLPCSSSASSRQN